MEEVDVSIVGGGPTGLFTALLLHRLGISVCVLDAKPSSLDLGRADALNARTQQYLEVAGLLDELLAQGLKCNTSSTFSAGEFKSRQNQWWVSLEHTLHKNFLMIGQPVIEAMLQSRLEGLVHYDEPVTGVSETGIHAEVHTARGRTVRSKYILGADGARSTIRNAIGASFTGTKPEMLWAVLDVFIDTDFPVCPEIITFQVDGQSRVSWIPRERGLARFYVLLEGEVSEERAKASIKHHMAPYNVDFKKVEWYSTFDVKERLASTFISWSGRILLAGDAAHVHSVNGGQGLNTGLSDAFALAWRLAMTLNHPDMKPQAVRDLIYSYDIERRQTAKSVIDVAAALVRDTVHTAKQYVSTIQRNAGYITGMGVSYSDLDSPLVRRSRHAFWKAGDRCPDVVVTPRQGGDARRLYSEVSYGNFILLAIGKSAERADRFDKFVDYISIVALSSTPVGLVGDKLTNDETQTLAGGDSGASNKEAGEKAFAADWVASDDSFVAVVRPDMYIGYVGDDWVGYLDAVLGYA